MRTFLVFFWVLEVSHFCPNMPPGLVSNGKKENLLAHEKWACASNFCEPNFQEFRMKWWRKELFLHCGAGIGWGWVEWDWHMGMSYFTSLNPQLFRNIAYVGFFKHVSVQLFSHVFCNSTKTITNSSDHPPAHYLYQQVSKTHIFVELYKQVYINVKLIDPRSHLWEGVLQTNCFHQNRINNKPAAAMCAFFNFGNELQFPLYLIETSWTT